VCKKIGIKAHDFYQALKTFKGAAKRLEKLGETDTTVIFRDFAHAPSKVKATTEAVKAQYPQRKLVAALELHTFSSLNKNFIPQYAGALDKADEAIVYFNPKTIEHKRMEMLSEDELKAAFKNPNLKVYTDSEALQQHLLNYSWQNANLLLMSSGNYNNINMEALTQAVLKA